MIAPNPLKKLAKIEHALSVGTRHFTTLPAATTKDSRRAVCSCPAVCSGRTVTAPPQGWSADIYH